MTAEIYFPQFDRTDGKVVPAAPVGVEGFDALKAMTEDQLLELGMGNWNGRIYLFPKEWYDSIPDGYIVTNIFGEAQPFEHGKTGDDTRFGMLAYGLEVENVPSE